MWDDASSTLSPSSPELDYQQKPDLGEESAGVCAARGREYLLCFPKGKGVLLAWLQADKELRGTGDSDRGELLVGCGRTSVFQCQGRRTIPGALCSTVLFFPPSNSQSLIYNYFASKLTLGSLSSAWSRIPHLARRSAVSPAASGPRPP